MKTENTCILIQNLQYKIPEDIKPSLLEQATREHQAAYLEAQMEELEEAKMQIADGFINDISEYDEGHHLAPYNKDDYVSEIADWANELYRNRNNLPKNIVIKSTENAKSCNEEQILNIAKTHCDILYQAEVTGISGYRNATAMQIAHYRAFQSFRAMLQSEDYAGFLSVANNIRRYSYTNMLSIYAKKADASCVFGYGQWGELGRGVLKGATRLDIAVPNIKAFYTEAEVKNFYKKRYDKTPNEIEQICEKVRKEGVAKEVTSFYLTGVYDISDTYVLKDREDKIGKILNQPKLFENDGDKNELAGLIKETAVQLKGVPRYCYELSGNRLNADSFYNYIYNMCETILAEIPESVVGIKDSTIHTGEKHTLETILATGLICKQLGINADRDINVRTAKALESRELQHEDKYKIFDEMFSRGFSLAKHFEKTMDDIILDKERQKSEKTKGM